MFSKFVEKLMSNCNISTSS